MSLRHPVRRSSPRLSVRRAPTVEAMEPRNLVSDALLSGMLVTGAPAILSLARVADADVPTLATPRKRPGLFEPEDWLEFSDGAGLGGPSTAFERGLMPPIDAVAPSSTHGQITPFRAPSPIARAPLDDATATIGSEEEPFATTSSYSGGGSGGSGGSGGLPIVTITASDAEAAETVAGEPANPGEFTVSRGGGSTSSPLTVNYTVGGTVSIQLSGSVTIPATKSSEKIKISVSNDSLLEATETITLTLAPGSGYTPSGGSATVSIKDNEQRPYSATLDDGTGKNGYNPGKIVVKPSVPLGSILIEAGGPMQLREPLPSSNHGTAGTTYPGNFFYFPKGAQVSSSIPEENPGDKSKRVVKVPDGHSIIVDYVGGIYSIEEGPTQIGVGVNFTDPYFVDPENSAHKQPANPL